MHGKGTTTLGGTLFWAVTAFDIVACAFLLWFFSFFLSGALPFESMYEGEKTYISAPDFSRTAATDYYRDHLDDNDKQAYDEIEQAMRSMSRFKTISANGYESKLQDLCQAVLADNPDIFWADTKIGYHSDGSGNYVMELFYLLDDAAYVKDKHAEYVSTAKQLAAEHAGEGDRLNIIAAHDWVCDHSEYLENDDDQSMYSVLEKGQSVCAGYSRTFQFFCQAMGIPCVYVPGEAGMGYSNEAHAWNIALMDSNPCYVDTTWDDKSNEAARPWTTLDGERFAFSHYPEHGSSYYADFVGAANVSRETPILEETKSRIQKLVDGVS